MALKRGDIQAMPLSLPILPLADAQVAVPPHATCCQHYGCAHLGGIWDLHLQLVSFTMLSC